MKTYTKTHANKKAAEGHLAAIKRRGGTAKTTQLNTGTRIDYSFPDKPAGKKSPAKKAKAKKQVAKKQGTKKQKRYDVISPDGFTIRMGVPEFKSIKERDAYFKMWKDRFKAQGYYSSVPHGRIPLEDLSDYCEFTER